MVFDKISGFGSSDDDEENTSASNSSGDSTSDTSGGDPASGGIAGPPGSGTTTEPSGQEGTAATPDFDDSDGSSSSTSTGLGTAGGSTGGTSGGDPASGGVAGPVGSGRTIEEEVVHDGSTKKSAIGQTEQQLVNEFEGVESTDDLVLTGSTNDSLNFRLSEAEQRERARAVMNQPGTDNAAAAVARQQQRNHQGDFREFEDPVRGPEGTSAPGLRSPNDPSPGFSDLSLPQPRRRNSSPPETGGGVLDPFADAITGEDVDNKLGASGDREVSPERFGDFNYPMDAEETLRDIAQSTDENLINPVQEDITDFTQSPDNAGERAIGNAITGFFTGTGTSGRIQGALQGALEGGTGIETAYEESPVENRFAGEAASSAVGMTNVAEIPLGPMEAAETATFVGENLSDGNTENLEDLGAAAVTTAKAGAQYAAENPARAAGDASALIAGEFMAGSALGRLTGKFARGASDRIRTAGGTKVDASDLTQEDVLKHTETDGAEGEQFPGAENPELYRSDPAKAVREQAADKTPEVVEKFFDEQGITDGTILKKALDTEPDGPKKGRSNTGFTSAPDEVGGDFAYETPGSFFGPELSPNFLRVGDSESSFSWRPGLPDFGNKATGVLARTNVENTDADTLPDFNEEMMNRAGDTTAVTKPGNVVSPGEIEAVVPPGAEFSPVGSDGISGIAKRMGIGSDFYTEVGGRRIPLRTVAPTDKTADSDVSSPFDTRSGGGEPLDYYREGFEEPTDRPIPTGFPGAEGAAGAQSGASAAGQQSTTPPSEEGSLSGFDSNGSMFSDDWRIDNFDTEISDLSDPNSPGSPGDSDPPLSPPSSTIGDEWSSGTFVDESDSSSPPSDGTTTGPLSPPSSGPLSPPSNVPSGVPSSPPSGGPSSPPGSPSGSPPGSPPLLGSPTSSGSTLMPPSTPPKDFDFSGEEDSPWKEEEEKFISMFDVTDTGILSMDEIFNTESDFPTL